LLFYCLKFKNPFIIKKAPIRGLSFDSSREVSMEQF